MEIINFAEQRSLVGRFMMELRSVDIQHDKMRFRRMVIPGDVLKLEVKLTNQRAGIYFADVCASVDGEVAARGEIMCALSDAK